MKPLLLSTLLLLPLLGFGQSLRVYPVGRQIAVFTNDTLGTNYDNNQVSVRFGLGFISVSFGTDIKSLAPAQFLNESGSAYGSTVQAAKTAYQSAVRAATVSGGGGGSSGASTASFGTVPANNTTYTNNSGTLTTTGSFYLSVENVGTNPCTINYGTASLPLGPGESREFPARLDATTNKYAAYPVMNITMSAGALTTVYFIKTPTQ